MNWLNDIIKNGLSCRYIICMVLCLGFMNKQFLRVNLNIAIVDLVEPENNFSLLHYEGQETRFNLTKAQIEKLIFSNFLGNVIFESFGGYLVDKFGPRRVMGYSFLFSAVLAGLFPLIGVTCGYNGMVVIRIMLGMATGGIYPSLAPIIYGWFAQDQWAKAMTLLTSGSLGISIIMPIFGVLIANYGWASVFYFTCASHLLFVCLWFYYVYDSPEHHPRISQQDKCRILKELKVNDCKRKNKKIPWRKMLTSTEIWAVVFTSATGIALFMVLSTQIPSFFNSVHRIDVRSNGLLNSLPFCFHGFAALGFATIADRIIKSQKLKVITVRKVFVSISTLLTTFLLILQGFFGMHLVPSLAIFILLFLFASATISGSLANSLDVAPNFSGLLSALGSNLACLILLIIIQLLSYFQHSQSDFDYFKNLFFVVGGLDFAAWTVFMIFGSDKPPAWNYEEENILDVELKEQKKKLTNA